MSYNDHLITIIMKPPKGHHHHHHMLEDKINHFHRNALQSTAHSMLANATKSSDAASLIGKSSVMYKDRVKAISLVDSSNDDEQRIESTLSSLSLHSHIANRKSSVEEILKTINSNDENIIFVQPYASDARLG